MTHVQKGSYMDYGNPTRLATRYLQAADMELPQALEVTAAGVALLVAQGIITTDAFFGHGEIKKYLAARKKFHPLFAKAATLAADLFEEDPKLRKVAAGLRTFAKSNPKQFQRALLGVQRVLPHMRSIQRHDLDSSVRSRMGRLFSTLFLVSKLDGRDLDPHMFSDMYQSLFERLAKLKSIPAPLRTLFRKLSKLTPNAVAVGSDPGAWFTMDSESRKSLLARVEAEKAQQAQIFEEIKDPQERSAAYRESANRLADLQGEAGVNLSIIEQGDQVPLADLLKKEQKLDRNGPTEYVATKFLQNLRQSIADYPSYASKFTKQEQRKFATLVGRAKTFESLQRVVQDAVSRGVLPKSWAEDLGKQATLAKKNKSIREGIPMTPLRFEPKTRAQFQDEHDTGEVTFRGEWSEEEKAEVLGRVSASIGQLEAVFGKGFCGKHARKLDFEFQDGQSGFSRASYFGWDNRNQWQPRVKFGKDYDGLLAHELSHFVDDLISHKAAKSEGLVPDFQYGDVGHGSGDIFGTTGQSVHHFLERAERVKDKDATFLTAAIKKVPELVDLMRAVSETEDYARWEDMLGQLELYLDPAIRNLTGSAPYEKGNPYAEMAMGKVTYRSELAPEVLEEAIKLFEKDRGGDTRKLTYWHSSVEVWARLCEQYIYNRLARSGISNPWLTRLTYDTDVEEAFVAEETFETKIEPIMDQIFQKLKGHQILATKLATRYLQGVTA